MVRKYIVVSPEMYEIEPVLDDGSGPIMYFRCAVEVDAGDTIEALVKALREKEFIPWRKWQKQTGESYYEGLEVSVSKGD